MNRFLENLAPPGWEKLKCHKILQNLDTPCPFCTNDIILKQKPEPYYWEFYNKNFDRHYAIVDRIIKWTDGRDVRFEMAKDITEHKKIETELKTSKIWLSQTMNIARVGGWKIYLPDKRLEWTDENFKIHELSNKNQPNLNEAILLFHEDDRPLVIAALENILQYGESFDFEARVITAKQKLIWVRLIGNASFDEDGILTVRGMTQDITERKTAERRLLESERLTAVGELASGVAHDFNNALQGILGNIELALIDNISNETRDYIITAKKSVHDAASRVNLLQRFARKQTEQEEYESIDLNDLISDSIGQTRTLWKNQAEKDGIIINITTHYGENILSRGNPGELRSVMYNIIKNSVQAMPQGGRIDIKTRKEGEQLYITIADTGLGMDENISKKIFQPFFTTKGFDLGKGLGMAGAYTIIKEHKGGIYVKRSQPGKGTEIEIILPYCQNEQSKEFKKKEYSGTARVLWVDDEETINNLAKHMLSTMGHQSDIASNGSEAIELLEINQYDLMITDIGMPNMNGWQLIEKIKGKYPEMKIAILTGWEDSIEPEQKTKFGVKYILKKPILMDKLKNVIGEIMLMKKSSH